MKKSPVFFLLFSFVLIAANAVNPVMDFKTIDEMKQSHGEIKQPKEVFVDLSQPSIKSVAQFAGKGLLKRAPLQAKTDVELLDSVIIQNKDGLYARTDYEYDNQGNKILQASFLWQADPGLWVGNLKTEYVHGVNEENDKTLIETRYQWSSEASAWVEQVQYDNVFLQQTNTNKIKITSNWDVTTSTWIPVSKQEKVFDDGEYDFSSTDYVWDSTNNKWKGEYKIAYIINEAGGYEELLSYYYSWGEDEMWHSKMTLGFNKKGNIVSEAMYAWVNTESYWMGILKTTIKYNADKELDENIGYQWDNASKSWVNYTLIESATDALDRPTYLADYTWDAANNRWIGENFYQKQYTDEGQVLTEENYSWHPINNIWVLTNEYLCLWEDAGDGNWGIVMKIETSYDLKGLRVERIQFNRPDLQSPWNPNLTWRGEYAYDDNDLNTQILYYSWDDENEIWVLFEKTDNQYNENGNMLTRTDYALVSDSWVITAEVTYYYSILVSGNNTPAYTIALQTYPNPVKDVIVVSGTKSGQLIRVLKADGSLLGTYSAQDDKTQINLSSFADGVLLLNIEKETMKIMKTGR
jgi:hypothetical protein